MVESLRDGVLAVCRGGPGQRRRILGGQRGRQGGPEVVRDLVEVAALGVRAIALGRDPSIPRRVGRRARIGARRPTERVAALRLVEVGVDGEAAAGHRGSRSPSSAARSRRRRDGVLDAHGRGRAGREVERPAEHEGRALVDALEAGLGVRDRLDRARSRSRPAVPPASRPRGRCSRCRSAASPSERRLPAASCGEALAAEQVVGGRVAAAAEHRQWPTRRPASPRAAPSPRFSTRTSSVSVGVRRSPPAAMRLLDPDREVAGGRRGDSVADEPDPAARRRPRPRTPRRERPATKSPSSAASARANAPGVVPGARRWTSPERRS